MTDGQASALRDAHPFARLLGVELGSATSAEERPRTLPLVASGMNAGVGPGPCPR